MAIADILKGSGSQQQVSKDLDQMKKTLQDKHKQELEELKKRQKMEEDQLNKTVEEQKKSIQNQPPPPPLSAGLAKPPSPPSQPPPSNQVSVDQNATKAAQELSGVENLVSAIPSMMRDLMDIKERIKKLEGKTASFPSP